MYDGIVRSKAPKFVEWARRSVPTLQDRALREAEAVADEAQARYALAFHSW
jgi:hypothetical protein